LYVIGAAPCAQFIALARRHSGVVVVGAVADVRPYLAHAAVAVAPVPVPFGSENCMLEAMAMQKVVVACPQALDAIPALCGEEVLTADDAGAFIHHIRSVLTDHAARAVALMARARVLRNCSWANSLAALDQLLRPISVAGLGDARRQAWHG
jgi:glycosyltransferase involved in cell wall biosynthesis